MNWKMNFGLKCVAISMLALLLGGCESKPDKEVFGRLDEDGHIASPLLEKFFPEKYKALPALCVEKRNDEYRVWLTFEDWQKGAKPWLKADMTDTRGDAAHTISDFRVTDSHVEFGKNYKIRPLKIIWPTEQEPRLRKGEYGVLHLKDVNAKWIKEGTEYEFSVTIVVANVATDTRKLSGELYLTGNDEILISKLQFYDSGGQSEQEVDYSGFVDADSFYLCEIDGKSAKKAELKTGKIGKEVLRRFRSVRLEHLAYGWQRNVELPK